MTPIDPFPSVPPPRSLSVPPSLAAGLVVAGKYELVRKLGTGAMGEVWAAKHLSLDEEVAIKLVLRDVEHEDGTTAESRFLLEARVAAALSRKTRHIVNVTDHGEDGPLAYLVMEILRGESLDARLARTGPLPLAKVVPIITQLARGLAVAHAEGIVHRDLKPSNVFVTRDEDGKSVVKILDFGIAKLRASMRKLPVAQPAPSTLTSKHATMHGFLLGTPAFMSPEQGKGKTNVDHRADVWALGVIAYHLLTDAFPFEGESFEELLDRLCRVRPTPISKHRPDLPPIVSDFFARAFAMSIGQRFQSALALAGAFEQLEPLAAGAAPSLPPPSPDPASGDDVSMLAAGIPPRRRLWTHLAAFGVVATVVAGTAGLVSIHLEREPSSPAAGLTSGANIVDAVGRDSIPSPAEVIGSASEPTSVAASDPPRPDETPTPRHASARVQVTASAPARPEPSPASEPKPNAASSHDKSEVF